jgi:hypothetical protein
VGFSDLTRRQSRYFCDSVEIVQQSSGAVLIQSAEKRSHHAPPIGFSGTFTEANIVTVERVYLQPGKAIKPNKGICRLFFRGGAVEGRAKDVTSIACGAQIDQDDRRTVPVIAFEVR